MFICFISLILYKAINHAGSLFKNGLFYAVCTFPTCTSVHIKELGTWTFYSFGRSFLAREIRITFMFFLGILVASITFSDTRGKLSILMFIVRYLINRYALPFVNERVSLPRIVIRTPSGINRSAI